MSLSWVTWGKWYGLEILKDFFFFHIYGQRLVELIELVVYNGISTIIIFGK